MVVATQNSIEHEGTFPLPEAQLDRFLMHVLVELPDARSELEILDLVEREDAGETARSAGADLDRRDPERAARGCRDPSCPGAEGLHRPAGHGDA